MKQIVIIHDDGVDAEEAISNWVRRLMCMDACKSLKEEILTRWVIARKDFSEASARNLKDTWTTLAISEKSISETKNDEKDTSQRTEETVPLEVRLHEIADLLPYIDCMVYLFIFLRSNDLQAKESFIPLAGAIKRLVEWHNANATVVKLHSELSSYGQMLVDFSNCSCLSVTDTPHVEWPHWHGKLSVMDHVKCEGHVFPHFTLHHKKWNSLIKLKTPDDAVVRNNKKQRRSLKDTATPRQGLTVCGRQIEVLQEIDLRTFPVFMLTPWTLELQSFHDESHSFKSFVQDMKLTGLLARVRIFYNLHRLPSCGDTKSVCSAAWKDYITSSPKTVTEPKEELISPCTQFMYFLILPNNFLQSISTSSSPPLLAQVLVSPSEMSPAIFRTLDQQFSLGKGQEERKDGNSNQIDPAILSLPMIKADKFHKITQLLQERQTLAAKNWLDGQINLNKEEFLKILARLEEHALDCMIEGCASVETYIKDDTSRSREKSLMWISECSRPFSACPEKIALQLEPDHLGKSCKTDNISSSTPLSERKQKEKSGAKDFLLEDVLSYFQPDGAEKRNSKSSVELKSKSICRILSQPDLSSEWPDNQFIKYHDVYYFNSDEDLNFEKRFVELRDEGNFDDTRSSFVTPKKKGQGRPVLRLSPVRSSPRSKKTPHSFSRAYSQSLSSGSPMKKFKTTSDLFKQPLSRITRQSPRKRAASPFTPSSNPPPLKLARTHQIGSLGSLSDLSTPVRRSPRKKLIGTPQVTSDPKVKRLSLTPVSEKTVRRSPRKMPSSSSASFGSASLQHFQSFSLSSSQGSQDGSLRDSGSSQDGPSAENKMTKMKRSDRHKMRLQSIIATVLKEKDVKKGDAIYSSCFRNLFNVSLVLLKALPNSRNLTDEMKSVVYAQVQQIINLEKRRSGIAL